MPRSSGLSEFKHHPEAKDVVKITFLGRGLYGVFSVQRFLE